MAVLLTTKQPTIELKYMDIQIQAGEYDSRLFALALPLLLLLCEGTPKTLPLLFQCGKDEETLQDMPGTRLHHYVPSFRM